MDMAKVKALMAALERSALGGLEYEGDGFRLALWRPGEGRAPAASTAVSPESSPAEQAPESPGEQATQAPAQPHEGLVTAPLVGTVYRAREPGGRPLVSVGDRVAAGQTLCLIEAMKMFNEITAPADGLVAGIHFEDGAMAQYGAALMTIEASS